VRRVLIEVWTLPATSFEKRSNCPRPEALRLLYWRSEILQVMFWLKAEGFGDEVSTTLLERFLGVDAHLTVQHLEPLVDEGCVERVGHRYRLSEAGLREGRLEFAASFEGLMNPAHGRCPWCHDPCDEGHLLG
jgi:hypothetical protein